MIAREAEQHNIDLRLCGEMAGDPMCVAILIGLGFRHLSMNGRSVARVKYLLRHIEQDEARELAARSLGSTAGSRSAPSGGCVYGATRHGRFDPRRPLIPTK